MKCKYCNNDLYNGNCLNIECKSRNSRNILLDMISVVTDSDRINHTPEISEYVNEYFDNQLQWSLNDFVMYISDILQYTDYKDNIVSFIRQYAHMTFYTFLLLCGIPDELYNDIISNYDFKLNSIIVGSSLRITHVMIDRSTSDELKQFISCCIYANKPFISNFKSISEFILNLLDIMNEY
jgi:hypothetical protein